MNLHKKCKKQLKIYILGNLKDRNVFYQVQNFISLLILKKYKKEFMYRCKITPNYLIFLNKEY